MSPPPGGVARALALPSQAWMRRAACREMPTSTFFPWAYNPGSVAVAVAKKVCAGCPVRAPCLRFALDVQRDPARDYGIWGGTTPDERRRLRR